MSKPWLAAVQAALYSWGLAAFGVLSTMVAVGWTLGSTNGGFNDWPSFVTYFGHTWFAGILGLVFQIGPYARARQGYTAAQNASVLPPPEQNQKGTP